MVLMYKIQTPEMCLPLTLNIDTHTQFLPSVHANLTFHVTLNVTLRDHFLAPNVI